MFISKSIISIWLICDNTIIINFFNFNLKDITFHQLTLMFWHQYYFFYE